MNKNNFNRVASTFSWLIALLTLSLILLIAIIILSNLIDKPLLSISKEINIIDIIECVVSVCSLAVGLFIIEIFNKKSEREKSEKDLIISLIKKIMDDIDNIYKSIHNKPLLANINLSIKDLYTDYKFLKEVEKTVANNDMTVSHESDFISIFRKFRSAYTRTSAKGEVQKITLIKNKMHFSTDALQEANVEKNNLKLSLLKLMNEYL